MTHCFGAKIRQKGYHCQHSRRCAGSPSNATEISRDSERAREGRLARRAIRQHSEVKRTRRALLIRHLLRRAGDLAAGSGAAIFGENKRHIQRITDRVGTAEKAPGID
jgi:hypothetical protein